MIDQKYLKECLSYDPGTGLFVWLERPLNHFVSLRAMRICNSRMAGRYAGCSRKGNGRLKYLVIEIAGVKYRSHRIAWLYAHGSFPSDQIDHIDGNGENNRLSNLRSVTRFENARNTKLNRNNITGCPGVTWHKAIGKWQAYITHNRVKSYLGVYSDLNEAISARNKAQSGLDFHKNHGRKL